MHRLIELVPIDIDLENELESVFTWRANIQQQQW